MQLQFRRAARATLKGLFFAVTVAASIPLGVRIAEPLTHLPPTWKDGRGFPVLVLRGNTVRIAYLRDSSNSATLRPGETYLVPLSQQAAIAKQLFETDGRSWVLNVSSHSPTSQRVELFILNDGYWGGGYLATSTAVDPLYWKITGPGFTMIFGGIAVAIAAGLWVVSGAGFKWATRALAKAHAGPA